MKKQFLIYIFFVLLFYSCSGDSELSNDSLLIKKMVSTTNGNSKTTNYFYNGNKLTSIQYETISLNYTYLDDNIINIKRTNGSFIESETYFEYDSQERVSSELFVYYVSNISEKTIYTYLTGNTISYQKYYGDTFSQPNIGDSGVIYNTYLGDKHKIEQYSQGQLFRKQVWTYDDKNNPLKNIVGINKLPLHLGKYNNCLTAEYYNSSFALERNSTLQYTYNRNDFPTQCIQNLYYNNILTDIIEINYFYE